MGEWWQDKSTFICELTNEEWGIDNLHGKKEKDGWRYCIVYHRYGTSSKGWEVKNGKMVNDEPQP